MTPSSGAIGFFICFAPFVCAIGYNLGARAQLRKTQEHLRRAHAEKVARWHTDIPPIPPIDPTDPTSLVDTYGQTVYTVARLSYDAVTAPDEQAIALRLRRHVADINRLEADLKSRLSPPAQATEPALTQADPTLPQWPPRPTEVASDAM